MAERGRETYDQEPKLRSRGFPLLPPPAPPSLVKMIPSVVSTTTKSAAERRVFAMLEQTDFGEGAICLHSLNLAEHLFKLVGELDFVILTPDSLLVVEVKGGRIANHDGVWTFTDRFGREHHKSEGPFEQARSGMFSLRERLSKQFGEADIAKFTMGFGVMFPDCRFDIDSVGWSRPMIFDASQVSTSTGIKAFLTGLDTYWRNKHAPSGRPEPELRRRIAGFLRPDFERVPPLTVRANELDRAMTALTEEQCGCLDFVEDNPRILCAGGAGSGKTFLAAEFARRQAALGRKTLLTCQSPYLSAFLSSRLSDSGVHVAAAADVRGDYEVLVMDEGQDLLNSEALDALDSCIDGGWAAGRWAVFYDPNHQSNLVGHFDPESVAYLRMCGSVSTKLRRNCRNTKPIVVQTQLITGADLGIPAAGEGPSVRVEFIESKEDELRQVAAELARLRSNSIPPGDITILGEPRITFVPSYGGASAVRPVPITTEISRRWPASTITTATVGEFKGLENNFILLTGINFLDASPEWRRSLYTGMSRARVGLWLAIHESHRGRVTQIMKDNLPLVVTH